MRYFVFKDSEIQGPFAREELDLAGGLRPETLVCEEGASGGRDADWRCLEEVPELSGLKAVSRAPVTFAEELVASEEGGLLERLALETAGLPGQEERLGEWAVRLFEDAELKRIFLREAVERPGEPKDLLSAQERIRELSVQLKAFQDRVAQLESRQAELLKKLEEAGQRQPQPAPAEPPPLPEARAPQALPQAAEAPVPDPFILPEPKTFASASAPAEAPSALPSFPEAQSLPGAEAMLMESSVMKGAPMPAAAEFSVPAPAESAEGKFSGLEFEAPQTFQVVATPKAEPAAPEPEPAAAVAPALEPPPPVVETPTPPPPVTLRPPPEPAFTPPPAPLTPIFGEPSAPAPSAEPPVTLSFSAPAEPPIPAMTPMPSPPAPSPTFAGPVSTPSPETQEVIARLAKPAEAPEPQEQAPARKRPPLFLIAGGVLLLALIVSGWLFLRNTRELKTMVDMGADQSPLGTQNQEEAAQGESPPPEGAAPAQPEAPQPEAAAIPDPGQEAVALVKEYPLDGERGTVAQWLQYSFTADPGQETKEEWTAGAVDADIFQVQYRALPGPNSGAKEPISYLFEADLGRKIVRGINPRARDLMAGEPPRAKPKKPAPARRAPRPAPAAVPSQPAPKRVPLMPLPTEDDLQPPAEDDAAFKSDTVRPDL